MAQAINHSRANTGTEIGGQVHRQVRRHVHAYTGTEIDAQVYRQVLS